MFLEYVPSSEHDAESKFSHIHRYIIYNCLLIKCTSEGKHQAQKVTHFSNDMLAYIHLYVGICLMRRHCGNICIKYDVKCSMI